MNIRLVVAMVVNIVKMERKSNFWDVIYCLLHHFLVMVLILQWNAQSIRGHGSEFKKGIEDLTDKPDVICIQETWLVQDQKFNLPGYDFIRKDRPKIGKYNPHGGCGIFIKKGLAVSIVDVGPMDVECQVLELRTIDNIRKMYILNVYNPSLGLNEKFLECAFGKIDTNVTVFVCGDLNGHSTLWGSEITDKSGKAIEAMADDNDFMCLNDGTGTRIDVKTGKLSCIDVTFCSEFAFNRCRWNVLSDNWGSDHFPIISQFGGKCYYSKKNLTPRWNVHKAKWGDFDNACKNIVTTPDHNKTVNDIYDTFIHQLDTVLTDNVPKTKPSVKNRSPVPWWNEECSRVIKERKKALNVLNRGFSVDKLIDYKRKKAVARRVILKAKRDDWERFCDSINSQTDTSKVWRKIRNINKVSSNKSMPILEQHGCTAVTDIEKCNIMADSFAAISSNVNYDEEFVKIKKEAEDKFQFAENDSSSMLNEPFGMAELDNAISLAKCTTPGGDGISNAMIKRFPIHIKYVLLDIFNVIWTRSECPLAWGQAVLIPILKPGKSPTDPLSYRPIALTSAFCKLMERMVNKRLLWFLEANKLLDPVQSGFRQGRRTTDHLINLENCVNKGFANKENTVAVFLDIQKAYDMVWRKGVLIKLQGLGVAGKMVRWIDSFLSNRTIQVRINGLMSRVCKIDNGVPQGSVISPLLFNILVSDLPAQLEGVVVSQFADDIAIWKSHRNVKFATKKVQVGLDSVEKWCKSWGFKLSAPKTVGIVFTNKPKLDEVDVKIAGNKVIFKKNTKFLGLIFDRKLNWTQHVQYIQDRCKKRLQLLKCISSSKWGADSRMLLRIYRALIRPIIEYGCEVFDSASDTLKAKLDSIQYRALKICAGAVCRTSLMSLQVECGEAPLSLRRNYLVNMYAMNVKSMKNHPNRYMLNDCWQKYYFDDKWNGKLHRPFESRFDDEEMQNKFFDTSPVNHPFWNYRKVVTSFEIHDLVQNIDDVCLKREIVIRQINSTWSTPLHVYTDGSVNPESSRVGCCFVVPAFRYSKGFRLSDGVTIFSAELLAILFALEWVDEVKPMDICIFSDCYSAISIIASFDSDNKIVCDICMLLRALSDQGIGVSIVWIPGHCDVFGNECADSGAKSASRKTHVDIHIRLDKSAFRQKLKKVIKSDWQALWNNYNGNRVLKKIKPNVNFQMNSWSIGRRHEVVFRRLRLGSGIFLKEFLWKIGKHVNGKCEVCGVVDDVEHFLLFCGKYKLQRDELKIKMQELGFGQYGIEELLGGKDPPLDEVIEFVRQAGVTPS